MKTSISYCSIFYYDFKTINQWIWTYKPYTNVKGFIFRFFGIYINYRENNATEKLIDMMKVKSMTSSTSN